MIFLDPTILAISGTVGATALALTLSASAIIFRIRQDRLPDATAYENIREQRIDEERRLEELRHERRIEEQKASERDRLMGEVNTLSERLDLLKLEYQSLDTSRREIEEVKADAMKVAAEKATADQDLAAIMTAIEEKSRERDGLAAAIDRLREQQRHLTDIEEAREDLIREKADIASQLALLRAERDNALRAIDEARSLDARQAALSVERDQLSAAVAALRDEYADSDGIRNEVRGLRNEKERLADEIQRLNARQAVLNEKQSQATDASTADKADLRLMEDLLQPAAALAQPGVLREARRPEADALRDVSDYLKTSGLNYSRRIVRAFHTALKINDHSQLTVLAGVSGTGKSLLPRKYAEAMGMHFLQIAVEPRWDSPQDLLGFYNYIEKGYRATDLARLLAHMDPYQTIKEVAGTAPDRRAHMALVLLDEMNLARVEYYFSEFLSRLEARPPYALAGREGFRKDALIPIDVRGLANPLSLYPAHNVLFAGTMNDDESTQALSDKVLDRSNVLQFAAPKEFEATKSAKNLDKPNQAQSFDEWRGWIRSARLSEAEQQRADETIKELAKIMEACGRPFGHRLRNSMLAYAACYPKEDNDQRDIHQPLCDQIEFRILPKLRGLEIESHREAFENLGRLIGDRLKDAELASELDQLCEKSDRAGGLFVWRGLTRKV